MQLEQTGHVFAAAAKNSHASTLAHATKLRRDLPVSIDRFHSALDALQDDIVCCPSSTPPSFATLPRPAPPLTPVPQPLSSLGTSGAPSD